MATHSSILAWKITWTEEHVDITTCVHHCSRSEEPLYKVARLQETLKAGEESMGRRLAATKGLSERTHIRHTRGHLEELAVTYPCDCRDKMS